MYTGLELQDDKKESKRGKRILYNPAKKNKTFNNIPALAANSRTHGAVDWQGQHIIEKLCVYGGL